MLEPTHVQERVQATPINQGPVVAGGSAVALKSWPAAVAHEAETMAISIFTSTMTTKTT
jgi:hypothetical protein